MARRQNPKIERTLKRASSLRIVKQTFLIVCEGEVTEPEYFNSFRLTSANVKAIGKGMNTISLVKEAIAIRDIEKRRNRNYDQCWVVFDKDDFSDSDFNGAIQMAQANGFHVAYSNQAFEFRLLLFSMSLMAIASFTNDMVFMPLPIAFTFADVSRKELKYSGSVTSPSQTIRNVCFTVLRLLALLSVRSIFGFCLRAIILSSL